MGRRIGEEQQYRAGKHWSRRGRSSVRRESCCIFGNPVACITVPVNEEDNKHIQAKAARIRGILQERVRREYNGKVENFKFAAGGLSRYLAGL